MGVSMPDLGTLRPEILGMWLAAALVTWATRFGGVWLVRRIPLGPRWQAALATLPGAILAALVAPVALQGAAETAGALITLLAARRLPAFLAIAIGLAAVVGLRLL